MTFYSIATPEGKQKVDNYVFQNLERHKVDFHCLLWLVNFGIYYILMSDSVTTLELNHELIIHANSLYKLYFILSVCILYDIVLVSIV